MTVMRFDSVHLGYTATERGIVVHYPHRSAGGSLVYGSGFPIGAIPPSYWSAPPNPITAERVRIWEELAPALQPA
jgi:hypothetical protein